jgi:hypothetical protein
MFRSAEADAPRGAPAAIDSRTREAWGAFLHSYRWDRYLTLTCRRSTTPALLMREVRRFIRRVERAAQGPVRWFVSIESTARDHHHAHALLYGTSRVSSDQLERAWKPGFTRMPRYDATRGAAYYVRKALGEHYELSAPLPPSAVPLQGDGDAEATNAAGRASSRISSQIRRRRSQPSVKRRAASSPWWTCRISSSVVRRSIEVLLSLLFALVGEAEASAHRGGAWEWAAPTK